MKRRTRNVGRILSKSLGLFSRVSTDQIEASKVQTQSYLESNTADARQSWIWDDDAVRPPRKLRWLAAATAVAAVAAAVLLPSQILRSAPAVLEDSAGTRKIQYGELVRPSGDRNATLSISDGSRVEASPQSEFSLERAEDGGTKIRLNRGAVTVVAAAVGEVLVQQGEAEVKLRPGEQVTSNPITPEPRDAFEVISIRKAVPTTTGGGGARGAAGQAAPQSEGGGACRGRMQLDPSRFAVSGAGVYFLIALAYGLDEGPFPCGIAKDAGFLTGGPGWIQSENFDIEARIPDGPPALITEPSLRRGTPVPITARRPGPRLRSMVRTMLEDRFKLKLWRDLQEMPASVLSVAPGGPKVAPYKDGGWVGLYLGVAGYPGLANSIAPPKPYDGMLVGGISGGRATMTQLAVQLSHMTGRPVQDRTNLPGFFTYEFFFAPADYGKNTGHDRYIPDDPRPKLTSPSLFKVLEDELGLKLTEQGREKVEVLVIESAERPSEN